MNGKTAPAGMMNAGFETFEDTMSTAASPFPKIQRHLARRDPTLKGVIRAVGPCTLRLNPDPFAALVQAIISQQISTRAAAAIRARLEQALGRGGISPRNVLRAAPELLREAGLSGSKAAAVRDLAERVHDGAIPLQSLGDMPDEEVIQCLLPVRGIGRWTAEMCLIFSLGRMDVLPVDDWGLREAVRRQYGLEAHPKRGELQQLGEPWRPYRSIATWYLWRSLGFVPQSEPAETG